jgi:hypothetical protein
MQVEFTLREEDYLAVNRYFMGHLAGAGVPFRGVKKLAVICTVLLAFGALWMALHPRAIEITPGFLFVAVFAALIPALDFGRHRLTALVIGRMLRRNPNLLRPMSLAIAPEAISFTCETSASVHGWGAVQTLAVTDTHAFFVLDKRQALVLPRSAFSGPEEFTRFVETARRYHEAAKGSYAAEDG